MMYQKKTRTTPQNVLQTTPEVFSGTFFEFFDTFLLTTGVFGTFCAKTGRFLVQSGVFLVFTTATTPGHPLWKRMSVKS